MYKNNKNLVWIDLEMTGLNPEICNIIEISVIITDYNLKIISKGPEIAIYQPKEILIKMDKWNILTHTNNGLLNKVKNSKIDEKEAESKIINFISKWVEYKESPMCGNNVSHDRRFLFKYMPTLENYFHYRHLDVNSIKEFLKICNYKFNNNFKKKNIHRSLYDIYESINELNYYKKIILQTK